MSTVVISSDDAGPSRGKGIIAIDMDDVLCDTNGTIVHMHNELFEANPPISIDEFENYLYWHNRGWGTQAETTNMVGTLYRNGLMDRPTPIVGAKDALLKLKAMGYDLIIITARSEAQREGTEEWIAKYFPDIFDELHFTGAFSHLFPITREEHEGHAAKRAVVSHTKRSKAEVIHSTGALFLIDDSSENAIDAARADPPCQVLLFGSYPWNAAIIPPHGPSAKHPNDDVIYVDRERLGLLDESAKRRAERIKEGWLPEGVHRVSGWTDVVAWVEKFGQSDDA